MADSKQAVTSARRATALTIVATLTFWAFFQLSKLQVISEISPFAEDPVDAIGSFAFQIALVVGFLTFARSWRCRDDAASASKGRLVIRGCIVVLVSIAATLLADAITEFQHPTWDVSLWGKLLILGLGVVAVPVFLGGLATIGAANQVRVVRSSGAETTAGMGALDEALDDLWSLVESVLSWLGHRVPWLGSPLRWVGSLGRRTLATINGISWLSPRSHPWRFCLLAAAAVGLALGLAPVALEGMPPSLAIFVEVVLVFITGETAMAMLGFLLLGGYLGLRPPLRLRGRR